MTIIRRNVISKRDPSCNGNGGCFISSHRFIVWSGEIFEFISAPAWD